MPVCDSKAGVYELSSLYWVVSAGIIRLPGGLGTDGNVRGNDICGWTDPLVGRSYSTAFVDVSNQLRPVYLGFLDSHPGAPGGYC